MSNLTLKRTECGNWITDFMGRNHTVRLNPQDEQTFVTMGLVNQSPVRIETNTRGDILEVTDNRTGDQLSEIVIPKTHFLYREANIGKPFKE